MKSNQSNQLQVESIEKLIHIQYKDSLGIFRFANVPKYSILIAGEMIIRYRDPPIDGRLYSVVYSHNDPIHFPIYPPVSEKPKLSFNKRIIQAHLIGSKYSAKDVTDTVLEYAGPKCDFYKSAQGRVPQLNTERIFWNIDLTKYTHLKIVDSFGMVYSHDLKNDITINWPP